MHICRLAPIGLGVVVLGALSAFGVTTPAGVRKAETSTAAAERLVPAADSFRRYGTPPPFPAGTPGDVLFSPDGQEVTGFFYNGKVGWFESWDVRTGARTRQVTEPDRRTFTGAYLPGGKRLLTASLDDTLLTWDLDSQAATALRPAPGGGRPGAPLWLWNVKLSPDGRTVACPAPSPGPDPDANGIVLLELASGHSRRELAGPESKWATAFAFSPDGRYLLGAVADGCVVWDLATGKIVHRLDHTEGARAGAFAPDGRTVAVAGEFTFPKNEGNTEWQRLKFIDLASGRTRHCTYTDFRNEGEKAAAFSPDGRLTATLAMRDPRIRLWDPTTGDVVAVLDYPSPGTFSGGVAFAPDGKLLAVTTSHGNVLVWDLTKMPFWNKLKAAPRPPLAALHSSTEPLSKADLHKLWDDLAAEDGAKAYGATWALALHGTDALALFRERLRPAEAPKPEVISPLLAALDDDDYATRQRAACDLNSLAKRIAPDLRAAQRSSNSAEVRHRLGVILEGSSPELVTDAESLRSLHAVEALEHIGGPAAIELLQSMTKGASGAPETREAEFALQRLTAH
jgi:hypothetical protein